MMIKFFLKESLYVVVDCANGGQVGDIEQVMI